MSWTYDAHVHLSDPEYKSDMNMILNYMDLLKIKACCVSMDLETSNETMSLYEKSKNILPFIGIHPEMAQKESKPVYDLIEKNNEIIGNVIYIDNYENVVTNISRSIFEKFGKSRPYTINARNYKFNSIVNSYSDSIKFGVKKELRKEEGKKIALFNKSNFLELAIYKSNPSITGGASSLFGLKYRDTITIKFD